MTYTVTVTNEGPGDFTAADPASFADDLTEVLDDATFVDGSITHHERAPPRSTTPS